MRYYVIARDNQDNRVNFSVNAVSIDNALRKAERVCNRRDIWKKQINVYIQKAIPDIYRNLSFELERIK